MSIIPNVIRVIAEGECTPRAFATVPRSPATGLVCEVPDDACVMGCISALVRRVSAVCRTLGIHAEYSVAPRPSGEEHKKSLERSDKNSLPFREGVGVGPLASNL